MSSLLSSCLTEDVGRAEEENLGEIHRHVQVVVHERGILLGICQKEEFQLIHDGFCSVADPDPNPEDPDPPVFGPPGSGSFYHHAKTVRKTLIPTIF
jgi:hypothetical protein